MNETIRFATPQDAPVLLQIYEYYITHTTVTFELTTPSVEDFAQRITNTLRSYPYLVYEVDGVVVGYAYASPYHERIAYRFSVDVSIYFAHTFATHGRGHTLYRRLFTLLQAQGYHNAYACCTKNNERSLRFHKKMDFVQNAIFHNAGYKFDEWLDVVWLEKCLLPPTTPHPILPLADLPAPLLSPCAVPPPTSL